MTQSNEKLADVEKAISDFNNWEPIFDKYGSQTIHSCEMFGAYMAEHHKVILFALERAKSDLSAPVGDREKAYKVLFDHQQWRKGNDEYPMTEPKELSAAIEVALKALSTPPQSDCAEKEEWFFRWAARAKGGHSSNQTAIDMIWHHPHNPYRHSNPWDEAQTKHAEKGE